MSFVASQIGITPTQVSSGPTALSGRRVATMIPSTVDAVLSTAAIERYTVSPVLSASTVSTTPRAIRATTSPAVAYEIRRGSAPVAGMCSR